MMGTRKLQRALLLALLCLMAKSSWATDWTNTNLAAGTYTLATTTGNNFSVNGSGDYESIGNVTIKSGALVTLEFKNTATINFNGIIRVEKGELLMTLDNDITGDFATIKRKAGYEMRFLHIINSYTNYSTDCKLRIEGNSHRKFTISGGCDDFEIIQDGDTYTATSSYDDFKALYGLLFIQGGEAQLEHVVLTSSWVKFVGQGVHSSGNGSAVWVSANKTESVLLMDDCIIEKCCAEGSGSAIIINPQKASNAGIGSNDGISSIELDNCIIRNNFGKASGLEVAGTIRSYGASYCTLEMHDCEVSCNYNRSSGGGITWVTGRTAPLILDNCQINNNWTAYRGGGLLLQASATITNCTISGNTAKGRGGGIYYSPLTPGTLYTSWIPDFHPYDGEITLDENTTIENNTGFLGGGLAIEIIPIVVPDGLNPETQQGYVVETNINGDPLTYNLFINGATIMNNTAKDTHGGGIYMNKDFSSQPSMTPYASDISINYGKVAGNEALNGNGGGLFVTGGASINVGSNLYPDEELSIIDNTSRAGGGIYLANGDIVINRGNVGLQDHPNKCTRGNGGGINVSQGKLTMYDGNVIYNEAQMVNNIGGNGGGFFVEGGVVSVEGGTIEHNEAQADGGGFYVNVTDASVVTTIKGGAQINDNEAANGGGAYVNQGKLKIEGSSTSIHDNTATTNGGGLYAGADIEFVDGSIKDNTATNGGGLYIPECEADLDFRSGTFEDNYASSQGGGIYISEGATLNLKGTATLSGNHVPAAGQGGGIYMNGTLNVGGGTGTQTMKCKDNYAGASYSIATQNNVYLPSRSKYVTLKSDISHKTGGVYDTQIGITANGTIGDGGIPVVYVEDVANEPWLYALMADISTAGGAVFDDTQSYIAIHTRRTVGGFDKQFIYFSGCWTTVVTTNPGTSHIELVGDTYHIYTNQGLAWFSSLVNGLNLGSAAPANTYGGPQPQLKAKLEADVDMSQNLWVPLGAIMAYNSTSSTFTESATQGYTGEFDGQGHIIKGIRNGYLTGITRYGLFGSVGNGTVKNTFLDAYTNLAVNAGVYCMGGVSGTATGNAVISNSEARGAMDLTEAAAVSYVGGIVGLMDGSSQIHSCMAMPDLTFKNTRAGGLAGQTNSGTSVKNSFAYGSYTPVSNTVIGGLVGWNKGLVENCYSRLQGTEPSNFGWFAGTNEGSISICYAPTGKTNYVNSTSGTPTLAGHGNYAATALVDGKYGYNQQDQQIAGGNANYVVNGGLSSDGELGGLLATLNKWVETQTDGVAYSTWTRTMASPINADLPILELDDFVSAGSTDNVFIAYKSDLNDMIDYANANSTGGSVYLYDATPTAVNKSTNGNVRVYIDPNVGITQATGNTLNARVGVALDNSSTGFMAYDWHMFSSALRSAPMGLVYHSEEGTYYVRDNYATLAAQGITHGDYTDPTKMDPPMTTWNHTAGQIGYFPTDAPYGPWRNTGSLSQGFDFYCFHEPSRHWINFKREGKAGFFDHWNQYVYNPATDKHTQIEYTNESAMVSGKGYMVALSQPSMMMADGVLNNTATQSSNASYNEGSGYDQPLRGLNLVGNPYQSYLDFNQFATTNGIDTYYILDADKRGYIAYTAGATPQVDAPSRYIHPHQGFFVRVDAVQPITFNSTMRLAGTNTNVGGESSSYRDWEPRYALVNMVCTDGEGRNDFATIELDRPEQGGGRKAKGLRSGDASIWFRLGDEDYQIAFAPVGTTSAPLRFEAHADGVYTLRWNMQNADFSYLHLVDNLTGTDVDCLTTEEYRFEAKTSDYTSRFRLVFDFTGIDEPEAPEPVEGPSSFAFMMGDELVVNGEGLLQMFDLNGRQLFSTEIHGSQATVAMPKVAAGLYVLRVTNGNQVRTQKMVINK